MDVTAIAYSLLNVECRILP